MAALPRTYQYLAGVQDSAVDEALAAGTRLLEGPYLRFAVEVLLQRAQPNGLPAVIDCYHRIPVDLKKQVLAKLATIAPVLRGSIRSHDLQTRLNCLEIAGRLGAESLAYLFDLGLMDSDPKVRETSATLTRQMAVRLVADHPLLQVEPGLPAKGEGEADLAVRLSQRRLRLFEALLSGAQRYDSHLRSEAVEACMWFEPYLGNRFWALLEQSRSKLPRLLADLLIRSDQAPAAYLLMQATAVAELRPAAVKTIQERRDATWFRSVLRGVQIWHPWGRVRKSWNYIKDIAYLDTLDEEGWASLGNQAALPILIASSNLGVERKGMLMERLLAASSDSACRRQILLEAGKAKDWGLPLLQAALRRSSDPVEVRMAAYGLMQVDYEGLASDLARRLSTPGDEAAAGLVSLVAERFFWRLWTRFDTMQEERRAATLGGIRGLGIYLKDRLRVNLASTSTSHRLRAARIIGLLNLVDTLWRDMLVAAQDPSTRVRSAAVRYLGRSQRPELRQQLCQALDDPDGRVQANALEAIDEAAWPDRLRLVIPKLQSYHNRVRANAAKALARINREEATRVLTGMLADERADHRITAIWTIKQIGAAGWQERLAALVEHDPEPAVRRYAQMVRKELEALSEASNRPQGAVAAGPVASRG